MKSLMLLGVLSLLFLSSKLVWAVEQPPSVGFDCWISAESRFTTYFIRCIHDRNLLPAATTNEDPEVDRTFGEIQRLLHSGGSTDELDRLVRTNARKVQRGFFTSIRIFSYPSEWSWEEQQPQLLVQTLCPEGSVCRVFVRPD
jgi:hypothetical protein